MAELVRAVDVPAPVEATWAAAVDWAGQGSWMVGTRVWPTAGDGHGLGSQLAAFTGAGRIGVLDTMTITGWDPPRRCEVRHTGRWIRGAGAFEVLPLGDNRSRFVWSEWLELPGGLAGQAGWALLRPVASAGIGLCLQRFARWAPTR